jgi:hypothetical protein
LFSAAFVAVYDVEDYLVGGIVAFSCGAFKNVLVDFSVEVVVEEFFFGLAPKHFAFPKQFPP